MRFILRALRIVFFHSKPFDDISVSYDFENNDLYLFGKKVYINTLKTEKKCNRVGFLGFSRYSCHVTRHVFLRDNNRNYCNLNTQTVTYFNVRNNLTDCTFLIKNKNIRSPEFEFADKVDILFQTGERLVLLSSTDLNQGNNSPTWTAKSILLEPRLTPIPLIIKR